MVPGRVQSHILILFFATAILGCGTAQSESPGESKTARLPSDNSNVFTSRNSRIQVRKPEGWRFVTATGEKTSPAGPRPSDPTTDALEKRPVGSPTPAAREKLQRYVPPDEPPDYIRQLNRPGTGRPGVVRQGKVGAVSKGRLAGPATARSPQAVGQTAEKAKSAGMLRPIVAIMKHDHTYSGVNPTVQIGIRPHDGLSAYDGLRLAMGQRAPVQDFRLVSEVDECNVGGREAADVVYSYTSAQGAAQVTLVCVI